MASLEIEHKGLAEALQVVSKQLDTERSRIQENEAEIAALERRRSEEAVIAAKENATLKERIAAEAEKHRIIVEDRERQLSMCTTRHNEELVRYQEGWNTEKKRLEGLVHDERQSSDVTLRAASDLRQQVAQLRTDLAEQQAASAERIAKERATFVASRETLHREAAERLESERMDAQRALSKEVDRVVANSRSELESASREYHLKLKSLEEQHAEELANERQKWEEEKAAMAFEHEKAIAQLEDELKKSKARQKSPSQKKSILEARLATAKMEFRKALETMKDSYSAEISRLQQEISTLKRRNKRQKVSARQELQSKAALLHAEYKDSLEALKSTIHQERGEKKTCRKAPRMPSKSLQIWHAGS